MWCEIFHLFSQRMLYYWYTLEIIVVRLSLEYFTTIQLADGVKEAQEENPSTFCKQILHLKSM